MRHDQERACNTRLISLCGLLLAMMFLQGCAAVNSFPTVARAGDTVSVLVGGSAHARKETISVTLTDAQGGQWDLQALDLVRSVFNVRSDGRALGLFDAGALESRVPWAFGHEPMQTILVTDLPAAIPTGMATLNVQLNTSDNSAGVTQMMTMGLEIIPGSGQADPLSYFSITAGGAAATDFARLGPAPHAELSFGTTGAEVIGAASLTMDFDGGVLDQKDINVYVPEMQSRDAGGAFGAAQRQIFWRTESGQLFIDIVAPQGLAVMFLKIYVLHPASIQGNPAFQLSGAVFYDTGGLPLSMPTSLDYFP